MTKPDFERNRIMRKLEVDPFSEDCPRYHRCHLGWVCSTITGPFTMVSSGTCVFHITLVANHRSSPMVHDQPQTIWISKLVSLLVSMWINSNQQIHIQSVYASRTLVMNILVNNCVFKPKSSQIFPVPWVQVTPRNRGHSKWIFPMSTWFFRSKITIPIDRWHYICPDFGSFTYQPFPTCFPGFISYFTTFHPIFLE